MRIIKIISLLLLISNQMYANTDKFLFIGGKENEPIVKAFTEITKNLDKKYNAEFYTITDMLHNYYENRKVGADSNTFIDKLNEKYKYIIYLQTDKDKALKNPEMFIEEVRILKEKASKTGAILLVPTVCFKEDIKTQIKADKLAHRISDALNVPFIPTGQAWHKLSVKTQKNLSSLSYLKAASLCAYIFKSTLQFKKSNLIDESITLDIQKIVMEHCITKEQTPYNDNYIGYCTPLQIPFENKETAYLLIWGTSTEGAIGGESQRLLKAGGYSLKYGKKGKPNKISAYAYKKAYYPETLKHEGACKILEENYINVFLSRFAGEKSLEAVRKVSKNKKIHYIGFRRHTSKGAVETFKFFSEACEMNSEWHEAEKDIYCLPMHIAYGRLFDAGHEPKGHTVHLSKIYVNAMSGMVYTMLTGKNAANLPHRKSNEEMLYAYNLGYEIIMLLGHLKTIPKSNQLENNGIETSKKQTK